MRSTNQIPLSMINLAVILMVSLGLMAASVHATTPINQSASAIAQVAFPQCEQVTVASVTECQALVALYASTNGDQWVNRTGWLETTDICTWAGVTCEAGQVVGLDLAQNGLVGSLPAEIGDLSHLTSLKLQENGLTGELPPSLGNLTALELAFLSRNQLSGTLPATLGQLIRLQVLILSANNLEGELPAELWNLQNLTILALSNNQFRGELSREIARLNQLQGLYLADNRFWGELPAELGLLLHLEDLDLRFNSFRGEIPSSIMQLAGLEVGNNGSYFTVKGLNLHYNALYTSQTSLVDFLQIKNPDWAQTQTLAPINIQAEPLAGDTVTLTWTPIGYVPQGSHFEVYYAPSGTDTYTLGGFSPENYYRLVGLRPDTTYQFYVTTYTPITSHNNNELRSDPSLKVEVAMAGNPISGAAQVVTPTPTQLPPPALTTGTGGVSQDDYLEPVLPSNLLPPIGGFATVVAYELNLRAAPEVGSERLDVLSYGSSYKVIGQYQYPSVNQGLNGVCPTSLGLTGGQRWLQINVDGVIGWADARWLVYGGVYTDIPVTFTWSKGVTYEAVVTSHNYPGNTPINLVVRSAPTFAQTAEQVIPATHITGRMGAVLGADRTLSDDGSENLFDDPSVYPCGGSVEAIGRTGDALWIEIISADGVHGWVYHQYLTVLDEDPTDGDAPSLPVTDGSAEGVGVYALADVNVRLGPGFDYIEIGLIVKGQAVTMIDMTPDTEWILVETRNDFFGWAQRSLFTESNTFIRTMPDNSTPQIPLGSVPLSGGTLAYNIQATSIRNGAGFEYLEIGTLQYATIVAGAFGESHLGQLVAIVGKNGTGDWVYIQTTDGQSGWVLKEVLRDNTALTPLGSLPFVPILAP